MLTAIEVVLQNLGELDSVLPYYSEPGDFACSMEDLIEAPTPVPHPLCCQFDFIEVYAGAARITQCIASLRVSCGPPIDISFSEEFDLSSHLVLQWLTLLIAEKRLKVFFLSPPCTTYSTMRRHLESKMR